MEGGWLQGIISPSWTYRFAQGVMDGSKLLFIALAKAWRHESLKSHINSFIAFVKTAGMQKYCPHHIYLRLPASRTNVHSMPEVVLHTILRDGYWMIIDGASRSDRVPPSAVSKLLPILPARATQPY